MKNICKSQTLNIMALLGLIGGYFSFFIFDGLKSSPGNGDFFAFILFPASICFLILLVLGLILELLLYLIKVKAAFNFQYELLPKGIYYVFFIMGLIGGIWPFLWLLYLALK